MQGQQQQQQQQQQELSWWNDQPEPNGDYHYDFRQNYAATDEEREGAQSYYSHAGRELLHPNATLGEVVDPLYPYELHYHQQYHHPSAAARHHQRRVRSEGTAASEFAMQRKGSSKNKTMSPSSTAYRPRVTSPLRSMSPEGHKQIDRIIEAQFVKEYHTAAGQPHRPAAINPDGGAHNNVSTSPLRHDDNIDRSYLSTEEHHSYIMGHTHSSHNSPTISHSSSLLLNRPVPLSRSRTSPTKARTSKPTKARSPTTSSNKKTRAPSTGRPARHTTPNRRQARDTTPIRRRQQRETTPDRQPRDSTPLHHLHHPHLQENIDQISLLTDPTYKQPIPSQENMIMPSDGGVMLQPNRKHHRTVSDDETIKPKMSQQKTMYVSKPINKNGSKPKSQAGKEEMEHNKKTRKGLGRLFQSVSFAGVRKEKRQDENGGDDVDHDNDETAVAATVHYESPKNMALLASYSPGTDLQAGVSHEVNPLVHHPAENPTQKAPPTPPPPLYLQHHDEERQLPIRRNFEDGDGRTYASTMMETFETMSYSMYTAEWRLWKFGDMFVKAPESAANYLADSYMSMFEKPTKSNPTTVLNEIHKRELSTQTPKAASSENARSMLPNCRKKAQDLHMKSAPAANMFFPTLTPLTACNDDFIPPPPPSTNTTISKGRPRSPSPRRKPPSRPPVVTMSKRMSSPTRRPGKAILSGPDLFVGSTWDDGGYTWEGLLETVDSGLGFTKSARMDASISSVTHDPAEETVESESQGTFPNVLSVVRSMLPGCTP